MRPWNSILGDELDAGRLEDDRDRRHVPPVRPKARSSRRVRAVAGTGFEAAGQRAERGNLTGLLITEIRNFLPDPKLAGRIGECNCHHTDW